MPISHEIPANLIVELAPEDLAEHLLRWLAKFEDSRGKPTIHNLEYDLTKEYGRDDVGRPVLEAWAVLERQGFIAREYDNLYFVTKRGREALKAQSFHSFRTAELLPKDILHARLLPDVWSAFVRGKYDTAVFEAHRQVEIAVRAASGIDAKFVGVDLMRKAFHPDNGPLTNKDTLPAEREALMHLFAGAIGSYKNPYSHRLVEIEPKEAVEMVVLASHLLSIVDSRTVDASDDDA